MCRQFTFIAIGALILLPIASRAEVRPVLSVSPAHFHQTANAHLSGWLGMGIGVEINKKWAVTVAWEMNQSVFFTMEPPVLDTNRYAHIFAVEVVRAFRLPRRELMNLRAGINAGMGVETTKAYEYADTAVTYFERLASQRFLGSDQQNQAFIGMVVGLTAWISGL